jgi:hypothetical protein
VFYKSKYFWLYKIKNHEKKSFILAALLGVALFSCKKESFVQERPKTFEDFEKVMATDIDFNRFLSASLSLEKTNTDAYSPTVIINSANSEKKLFTEDELEELKSIKDFKTLEGFLKAHNVANADKKIEYLKTQSMSFYNFLNRYPEFTKLSKEQKVKLIHQSITAKDNFNKLTTFTYSSHQNRTMNADPAQMYGLAIQLCQDQYRIAFDAIWAGADVAMLFGSFSGGLTNVGIFAGACVATYFIDQARGACMDSAAQALYMSM